MRTFHDATVAAAPAEEVWKVLYDPKRFPAWWAGIETVEEDPSQTKSEDTRSYTMYPTGYPDFPMPQMLQSQQDERSVVISCLVSDLRFEWHLEPLEGSATQISVHVEIPDSETHRLESQQKVIAESLRRLAELAARLAGEANP
jgi:uncharacterized protein YndB with AHSA1/START domain